jgi:hypothetical protein
VDRKNVAGDIYGSGKRQKMPHEQGIAGLLNPDCNLI